MSMPNLPFSVDKILGWPISIRIRIPECEVIIEDDRIFYIGYIYSFLNIVSQFFKCEFWGMNPDNHESLVSIFFVPIGKIWKRSLTIDTRVRPEIYDNHFSLETRHSEWIRVDPIRETRRNLRCLSRIRYIQGNT